MSAREVPRREMISSEQAPAALGPYSQAVRTGNLVFLSGQIALDPDSMRLVDGGIEAQTRQVLDNLAAVTAAAGGHLNDSVKLTIYLSDLKHFGVVNQILPEYFSEPYPARSTIQVAALPLQAMVEIDAVLALP